MDKIELKTFLGDVAIGSGPNMDIVVNLIKIKEGEIQKCLEDILSKQCQIDSNMRGVAGAMTMLIEVSRDATKLDRQIVQTAHLAKSVSAKVRRLDMARSRVSECQQRVHDLIDLQLCSQGVMHAIAEEDFEIGAGHINRFLAMDLQLLKKTADDVQGSVSSVSNAIRTLEKATAGMRDLVVRKFNEAVKNDDLASVERFFKIFPLLGCHQDGIEKFCKYICLKLSIKNHKELRNSLDIAKAEKRFPLAFADSLTSLLENFARVIEVNQPIIEACYGPGHLLEMLKLLQLQCDADVKTLLFEFNKCRKITIKTQQVKEGCSRSSTSGNSTSSVTLGHYRNLSGGSVDKLNPKDIDTIIAEITIMHSRAELYIRFMKRRMTIQGQVYHRLGSLLPFPDQSYQFLQIYFVGNSNVETDRRCDISSNLRRDIIERLQNMLHAENELVRLFQTALDQMPSDEYAIVIRADKTPPGQHVRRFNAPPTEFLNSLDLPGLPPHNLQLKVGATIIMLRNINQPRLCNGTRLAIKRLMAYVIEATILTGKFKGEDVFIPRIPMIPTDMPFEFKRLQFPVRLAFAVTINKAQGQSLGICGVNLEYPVFSHGQLYVACSRVGKPSVLHIYTENGKTTNVVYHRALQ